MQFLMIHDIRPEYLDLDLLPYRLTFDDGLFSQYYYFSRFADHPEPLTFFITTSFIKPGTARPRFDGSHLDYLKSKKYMFRSFIEHRYDHFMNIEEIQWLADQPNVRIGFHSHFHDVVPTPTHSRKRKTLSPWKLARFDNHAEISRQELSVRSKLAFAGYDIETGNLVSRSNEQWEEYVRRDTEQGLDWMQTHLGIAPTAYCFPFNEYRPPLVRILESYGFDTFYAARPGEKENVYGRTDIDRLTAE
jgi:hypothetical protein